MELEDFQLKLLRELSQAEYDAWLHTKREAKRLGECPPAREFTAISAHAETMRVRLAALMKNQRAGHAFGEAVGRLLSNARHYAADRMITRERSYRVTLLGLRHGLDATHLLRFVSRRLSTDGVTAFCEELITAREASLARAVAALEWFVEHPDQA